MRNKKYCVINLEMKGLLTTKQVAEKLGVSPARVRRMVIDGLIKADKLGRDNVITEKELKRFEKLDRSVGRPPKESVKTAKGK